MAPSLTLVAAVDDRLGLSRGASIPWDSPEDRRHFRSTTSVPGAILLMGRGTFASMADAGVEWGPRTPFVLTSQPDKLPARGIRTFATLSAALRDVPPGRPVFVVGGARLYAEALLEPATDAISLTLIRGDHHCTTFFPPLSPAHFVEVRRIALSEEATLVEYTRARYDVAPSPVPPRPTHGEAAYLCLIQEALGAPLCDNRTGIPCRTLVGRSLRFDLSGGRFPLITTRRLPFASIFEELQWFLSGIPDATRLRTKIWAENTSREGLDRAGLPANPVGDAGPIYPFQWRHFGARYRGTAANYTGEGVDQIARLVAGLKRDPDSRRHVVSAWNPSDLPLMCLPPCHFAFQVLVKARVASLVVYQRSADMALGIPFNIASYALLLRLLCAECDFEAGELILHLGDVQVYLNHEANLDVQLRRAPMPPPWLRLPAERPERGFVDGFEVSHAVVEGYEAHPPLRFQMAL